MADKIGILRGDAGRVPPLVIVVIRACARSDLAIFIVEMRGVVTERDERGGADRHGVGAKRQRFRHVGAIADAAGDDELHLAVHIEFPQRLHRQGNGGEDGDADMLDEHFLRGGGAALHAVEHDDVRTRLDRERRIEIRPRRADLHIDRLLPIRDLAQLADLDLEVVRPGPVGMPAGGALIDALGQRAHRGHALRDLLTQEHAAAARLGALADDDLDGVRFAQMIRVHAVTRRQDLVDEELRVMPLLLGHAAVAGRGGGAHDGSTAAERLFRGAGKRAEAHAGDCDRDPEVQRLLGEAIAEHDLGRAFLAIAFEGVAAHGGAKEQEIVEMRHPALGAKSPDVIDTGRGGAMDLGDRTLVEGRRLPRGRMNPTAFRPIRAHQ
jgi:hypothetical protein